MDCAQLQAAMDAAYAVWQADPSPDNYALLQAAQGAWAQAGCGTGTGGGGVGNGPPGGGGFGLG